MRQPDTPPPTALVVLNGDDVYEDMWTAATALSDVLTDAGFVTRTCLGMARFVDRVDLIVLYTALGELTAAQHAALDRSVRAGAGLIAVHSTNVDERLSDLIGSWYVGHGPLPHESRFTVELDSDHEITAGIEPFDVTHEHYHIATAPDAHVIAWRTTRAGREPLVHVRAHGRGRVCYVQLGHDMRAWGEPAVRHLVHRAARWAAPIHQAAHRGEGN
jgi:type 1 glutamine amidotransferase